MQVRFSLRTLLWIPVFSAVILLSVQYLYSPRQRVLSAGGELHTNQTFGFDLNGNAWHGVLHERPTNISAINAAVFSGDANFDASIAHALNQIDTLEYLSLDGPGLDLAAVRELASNSSLRDINLGGTNIGDAEMLSLAAIPTLECLTVFQSKVTASGVRHFKELRPDVNLVNWYR